MIHKNYLTNSGPLKIIPHYIPCHFYLNKLLILKYYVAVLYNIKHILFLKKITVAWMPPNLCFSTRRFNQYRPLREDSTGGIMGSSGNTSVPMLLWNLLSRQSPGERSPLLQGRVVWKLITICTDKAHTHACMLTLKYHSDTHIHSVNLKYAYTC